MQRTTLALLLLMLTAATASADTRRWLRANFHAHSVAAHVDDDGTETPADLHRAVRAAGFDFSLHSPHCTTDLGPQSAANYAAALYEVLHQADAENCNWIAVDLPPNTPEWEAVHDRLRRAASNS